jgi:hypothetical protein
MRRIWFAHSERDSQGVQWLLRGVGVLVFTLGERSKILRELAHMKKWRSLKLEDAVQWLPVMPLDLKFPVRKPKTNVMYKLCFMGW